MVPGEEGSGASPGSTAVCLQTANDARPQARTTQISAEIRSARPQPFVASIRTAGLLAASSNHRYLPIATVDAWIPLRVPENFTLTPR
jgi:hypothetical protein